MIQTAQCQRLGRVNCLEGIYPRLGSPGNRCGDRAGSAKWLLGRNAYGKKERKQDWEKELSSHDTDLTKAGALEQRWPVRGRPPWAEMVSPACLVIG